MDKDSKIEPVKFVDDDAVVAVDMPMDDSEIADADMPTHERLRRFEDKHLGEDAPRVNGHVEKGIGSLFHKKLGDHHKAHHAALLDLMEAEKAHVAASAAEAASHAKLEAAIKRANETEPKD